MEPIRGGFIEKKCPKCGGNVFLDRDHYGWYEQCLQCGYTRELEELVDAGEGAGQGKTGKTQARARLHLSKN